MAGIFSPPLCCIYLYWLFRVSLLTISPAMNSPFAPTAYCQDRKIASQCAEHQMHCGSQGKPAALVILRRKEDLQRFLSAAVRSGQNGISFRKEIGVGMTDQEIVQVAMHMLSALLPSGVRNGVQYSVNQSQGIMELGW